MQLTLGRKLGGGAFGDVFAATDEIGRDVAVKVIRPDDPTGELALGHARILAKVDHPNIVRVLSVERIPDPNGSSREVAAVVMELVEGQTLTKFITTGALPLDEARRVGTGLLDGLLHMLERGIAHGDLHTDNVMVTTTSVKVIDILLLSHGSQLSTGSFQSRLKRDNLSLRLILQDLLQNVQDSAGKAKAFNDALSIDAQIADIRLAFVKVASVSTGVSESQTLDYAFGQVIDSAFVAGEAYAEALLAELPSTIAPALLMRMIAEGVVSDSHAALTRLLWAACAGTEKTEVASVLAVRINSEVPTGKWASPLRILIAFGSDGWKLLPERCRLRLEGAIVKDILNGYIDIYGPIRLKGGSLGTWAAPLFIRFSNREHLVENVAAMLSRSWYTQNYVGQYFMDVVHLLGVTDEQRKTLIGALRSAVSNDARLVVVKLESLPPEWLTAVVS